LKRDRWDILRFDPKSDRKFGSAAKSDLVIEFYESLNDPAIVVEIKSHRFLKGDPEYMMDALKTIHSSFWGL
jgi:hypothetical protein